MSEQPDPIVLAVHDADCGCSSLVHPELERWDYYARVADAVRARLQLRPESGLVFDGDVTDVRARLAAVSALAKAGDLRPARTEYAWCKDGTPDDGVPVSGPPARLRSLAESAGGAVYVREVTDWRPEVPDA